MNQLQLENKINHQLIVALMEKLEVDYDLKGNEHNFEILLKEKND